MPQVDLLEELKSQFKKLPKVQPLEEYSKHDQDAKTQFDIEVANCMKLILELIGKAHTVGASWESNVVSFTLEYKMEFVNELGHCIKDLKRKIEELESRVRMEAFQPRNQQEKVYQMNVCKCLESYLYKLASILMDLQKHTRTRKTRADLLLNSQKSKKDITEKDVEVTEYKPNIDSEFRTEALFLQQEVRKDRQQIVRSLQETFHMVDMMNIHALKQEDMAIEFRDTNILTLQNIRQGKRELVKANQNQGQSGEYWMWFFITLTIMIVIIDFAKK